MPLNSRQRLHVTQDDRGLWQLSVEHTDGSLELLAWHAVDSEPLIEDARKLVKRGKYADATILVDPPKPPPAAQMALTGPPPARKAGE